MKTKEGKNEETIDLNDAETRKLLHDPKAMRSEAVKAGVVTGLIGGAVGTLQSFFMIPEFVKKFKQADPGGKFSERLISTMKQNKLLAALVAAPIVVVAGSGMWGYSSAKSMLRKKEKELSALEQKEAQAASSTPTKEAVLDKPADAAQPTWVERTQSKNTAPSLRR